MSVAARERLRGAVLAWGEEAVLGRKGGVIGEGSCCTHAVRVEELDGPLSGRILCIDVAGVSGYAWVKKTMGISLGFQISHSDLTAASGRGESASK